MFTKKDMKAVTLNQVNVINGKRIYFQTTMDGRHFAARDCDTRKSIFTRANIDTAVAKINEYCK